MFTNQYEEHLASQPDNSRWDGFDRGDLDHNDGPADQGQRVIGRMTSGGGYRVVITEFWCDGDKGYEVSIDGNRVYSDFHDGDRSRALEVGRWWMRGCPA